MRPAKSGNNERNDHEYISALKQYTAALLVCAETSKYKTHIETAMNQIGVGLYDKNPKAQASREHLAEAIKLNLINRKQYPYETLQRTYNLPVSLRDFRRERMAFCRRVAELTGLVE